jgi:hypothetical protein
MPCLKASTLCKIVAADESAFLASAAHLLQVTIEDIMEAVRILISHWSH